MEKLLTSIKGGVGRRPPPNGCRRCRWAVKDAASPDGLCLKCVSKVTRCPSCHCVTDYGDGLEDKFPILRGIGAGDKKQPPSLCLACSLPSSPPIRFVVATGISSYRIESGGFRVTNPERERRSYGGMIFLNPEAADAEIVRRQHDEDHRDDHRADPSERPSVQYTTVAVPLLIVGNAAYTLGDGAQNVTEQIVRGWVPAGEQKETV